MSGAKSLVGLVLCRARVYPSMCCYIVAASGQLGAVLLQIGASWIRPRTTVARSTLAGIELSPVTGYGRRKAAGFIPA